MSVPVCAPLDLLAVIVARDYAIDSADFVAGRAQSPVVLVDTEQDRVDGGHVPVLDRGGPLEAARPCQRHRVVVRSVPPCPRGVRASNRSGGLSGLGTPDRMARRFGAGFRARDDPRVVSRLDAARRARTRGRTRAAPHRTDDDPSRAFDVTMSLLAHPSLDGHGIELRRSLQAIHPGLLERFLAKRARATAPVPLPG